MEIFKTYNNNQKINIKLKKEPTSIGVRRGKAYFYLRKEDDLEQFISLNNQTQISTIIDKKDIENYNILEIVTQIIVLESQQNYKEEIMKATKIDYSVFDRDNRKSFNSNYQENPEEYDKNGDSEIFLVRKLIKIILTENPQIIHKKLLQTLNIEL